MLGWSDATSFTDGQPADIVIGQPDFQTTLCNSGTAGGDVMGLGPDSLCFPVGVAVDSFGNLFVADTQNSRVLLYTTPFEQPMSAGFAAIIVFGQGSFTTSGCATGTTGLCNPQGVAVDSNENEYIADSGNNRVLQYNPGGGTTAQLVFGQDAVGIDFTDTICSDDNGENPAPSADGMCNPVSVALDAAGDLYVSDATNNRVLEFNQPVSDSNVTANLVFGQGSAGNDFVDNTCYNGGGDPAISADGLCSPGGIWVDGSGNLFAADTSNSRLLEYLNPVTEGGSPGTPGMAGDVTADTVFGQGGDFTAGICGGTAASGIAPSAFVLCYPRGVTVDASGDVFAADTSNNRVLDYVFPQASSPTASLVLGEMDLMHSGVNNPTAAALQ